MNKRQKEVIQHQLTMEKAVLDALEKEYEAALKDIKLRIKMLQSDPLTQSRIYHIQYQKTLQKQVEAALEKLHSDEYSTIQEYLSNSYTDAFVGTMYDVHGQGVPVIAPIDQNAAIKAVLTDSKLSKPLYDSLGVDVNKLKKNISQEISRGIASGLMYDEIARNIEFYTNAPISRAKTIVRTEGHRIQEASAEDARQQAKAKGADVVKQWDATLDGETRPTHRELDGQIREVDEPFEVDGREAMCPGEFGDPAEDCNCRCKALTRAKWALDEEELQTLKDRAKYFELDKTKDFDEFKEKFLKSAKLLESPGNIGEKAVPYSERGIEIEERLKTYLKTLSKAGAFVEDDAGKIANQDLAILTTETGVEYTKVTIGKKAYLIRGRENGTTIPDELWDKLIAEKGTIDCHSHPYIGDLVPSKSDRKALKLLNWQHFSSIIEPGQNEVKFDAEGAVVPVNNSNERDEDYYASIFGSDD